MKTLFFKGYVETKDKKCIEKFKGRTDFKTYEEVQSLPEFAGILAVDTILVDIDDMEQSHLLLNICEGEDIRCRVLQSRSGMHFLFKNSKIEKCYTKTTLACGLVTDIKSGFKNSYEVLKIDGKEREVLYDIFEDEEYQEVPKWLFPIKTNADFINMEAGDGRNQALFNYILTLQANDFSVDEARETIRLINKYILKEPLSDDELDVVLRDEAFSKPVFFKGTTFLFDKFALFLKNHHHIIRINNQLHLFKDGIYVAGQAEIESAMISHIPQLNRAKRQEVMSYLDILIRENTDAAPANMIAFRNGLYNVYDDSFVPFTPEHIITNKIEWDYNPQAYWDMTDEVLNNIACNDPAIRSLLEEMIGYCFFRRNEIGKAFILTGSGSNGKSTFLNMVKAMLGKRNCSSLSLKKLGERFKPTMLFGKLANIGDDISDAFIADTEEFKKIVTGETIEGEHKGKDSFDFDPYCKLIFSANSIPRLGKGRDNSALMRRLVIIPFNANFNNENPNFKPFIGDSLKGQESMEYLILLGIQGLKRVLINRKFTTSQKVQDELDEFEESNNPILGFFKECQNEEFGIENEPTNKVYKRYQEYCIANTLTPMSNGEFSKQVKKHFDFAIIDKKINGKKYRIFVKG